MNPCAQNSLTSRTRAGHRKSLTGCHNCKRRHLRCDEAKPECARCRQFGETCEWPSSVRPKVRGFKLETTMTMRVAALDCAAAIYAFEFFDLHTLPVLRECHPSVLWRSSFGFLAQSSVAFRKIATALGFQHQLLNCDNEAGRARLSSKANESYAQALRSLRLSIQHSEHALTTSFGCMLLVLLSSLRGERSDFLVHLACGLDILKKRNRGTKSLEEVRGIYAILQHYCVSSWLYSLSRMFDGRSGEYMDTFRLDDDFQSDVYAHEVPSLELSSLIAEMMKLQHAPNGQKHRLQRLRSRTDALTSALESGLDAKYVSPTSLATLKASVIVFDSKLSAVTKGHTERIIMASEAYMNALDHIETALKELRRVGRGGCRQTQLFAVDLGMAQTLDVIITTTVDRDVQCRALSMLELCPSLEGLWIATTTKAVNTQRAVKAVV